MLNRVFTVMGVGVRLGAKGTEAADIGFPTRDAIIDRSSGCLQSDALS